jgi:ribulose-5-phosphate 4-epimerase/fuculose-1-phosphate aldolase
MMRAAHSQFLAMSSLAMPAVALLATTQAYELRNAGAVLHSHSLNAVLATMLDPASTEFRVTHLEMIKVLYCCQQHIHGTACEQYVCLHVGQVRLCT